MSNDQFSNSSMCHCHPSSMSQQFSLADHQRDHRPQKQQNQMQPHKNHSHQIKSFTDKVPVASCWSFLVLFFFSSQHHLTNGRPISPATSSVRTLDPNPPAADALFQWLNFRNGTYYSPIVPSSPESLLQLNADQLKLNGLSLGKKLEPTAELKPSRRMRQHRHRVDANTPFTQRAICPFQFVLNHRPNRVPSTLVEVKCLSPTPSQRLLGRPLPLVECEPMRWNVRVLDCQLGDDGLPMEDGCVQSEEKLPLACVPVLQATKQKTTSEHGNEEDEEGEMNGENGDASVAVVAVPAQPLEEMPI